MVRGGASAPLHEEFYLCRHPEERRLRRVSKDGNKRCLSSSFEARLSRLAPQDDAVSVPTRRSRSSARRRHSSPSAPLARGGIPPASPCGISAATPSSSREC